MVFNLFNQVAALFPGARLLQAIVEYPVPLPGGSNDSMNDVFALLADADGLRKILAQGAEKARYTANKTLRKVRKKTGITY